MEKQILFTPNGQNRTPEIVEALRNASDGTELIFFPGIYDFYAEGAYEGYFCPVCNRSGDKRVIFPMLRLNDVTINGAGAKFIFHDRVFPFIVQGCRNVTLRDFSIDFSFERCLEGSIEECSDDGFLLKLDPERCAYCVNEYGNLLLQAGCEVFSSSERRYFIEQRNWHCFVAVGDIYYDIVNPPADVIYCDAEIRDNGVYLRYRPESVKAQFVPGRKVMLNYDELRENDVIFLDSSENVKLSHVRILHGAGMGIVGQLCENVELDHVKVAPEDDGLYSTTADAIMLINCSGKVRLDHVHVDRSVDDAVCIMGYYAQIERITDRSKAVARLMHPSQSGANLFLKGDCLRIWDGKTLSETGSITVKRSYMRDDMSMLFLEFEEEIIECLKPGDYLENPGRAPEIEITNSVFENFPGIRLASEKKLVFKGNEVRNCCGVLVDDLLEYWYEGGFITDMEIENNLFENMKNAVWVFIARPGESDAMHRNITVRANRFVNCECAVDASQTDGLTVCGNILSDVGQPMKISKCRNVTSDMPYTIVE